MKFELGQTLDAVYLIPMPNSWSAKKKEQMNGLPCLTKPDTDNITKAVKDALRKDDGDIWWERAEKRWAYKGSIILFA
jgi:Holliday junction resolvase RusA-like endonuclease